MASGFDAELPGILESLPAVRLEDVRDGAESSTTSVGLPRNPDFTAARLFSQKPHLIPIIIEMLKEAIPIIKIARSLGISINTVVALRDRCPAVVDAGRGKMAETCRTAARVTAEAILEDLSDDERRAKIPFKDKAISLGVLIDKAELLSGGVTARISHEFAVQVPDGAVHDAFNDFLRTGRGSVIDVDPTDLRGNVSAQMAGENEGQTEPGDASAAGSDDQGAGPGADPVPPTGCVSGGKSI